MLFETLGNPSSPAVLFFHAMGVTGASSEPVAKRLQDRYYCILPTSTVYCPGQRYAGKADELRQIEGFLQSKGVARLALVTASSLGADLALAFLARTKMPGGPRLFRRRPVRPDRQGDPPLHGPLPLPCHQEPCLVQWKDPEKAPVVRRRRHPALLHRCGEGPDLREPPPPAFRQPGGPSPFPPLPEELQRRCFFEFGSAEEHVKYRAARPGPPIPRGAFRFLPGTITWSTRSGTPKAMRRCSAPSSTAMGCRTCPFCKRRPYERELPHRRLPEDRRDPP